MKVDEQRSNMQKLPFYNFLPVSLPRELRVQPQKLFDALLIYFRVFVDSRHISFHGHSFWIFSHQAGTKILCYVNGAQSSAFYYFCNFPNFPNFHVKFKYWFWFFLDSFWYLNTNGCLANVLEIIWQISK